MIIDERPVPPKDEEVYLRIEGGWLFQKSGGSKWPQIPLATGNIEELAAQAVRLRKHAIVAGDLGLECSDLRLSFADDGALYISGNHPEYESWEFTYPDGSLVNLPGGGLAIF